MLRRQTLIALGVAVVLGLLAVFLANSYISGRERSQDASATSKVAVAAVPLGFGAEVTPDKVKFVEYPNSGIPPGSFRTLGQLLPGGKKRVVLLPLSLNEPILASKISGEGQGASIANLLPDGMRAATVRVNAVSGVAGFVQPNDTVDVLITRSNPGGGGQVTDVLLQNIRVIAIDTKTRNADGSPKVGRTATLEVTPIDAQKLALGETVGNLSLVLRKPGEASNPVVETVSFDDLRYNLYGGARYPAPATVGAYQPAPPRAAPARPRVARKALPVRPPEPVGRKVEIVRGTQGNEYKVGG